MKTVGQWDNEDTDNLIEAVLELRDRREAKAFFRDLLTEQEIIEFGKRWRTARMLAQGQPYTVIVKETGLSTTTVARISKWLREGAGGYQLMLKRLGTS